jgi:hypothetical protein
VEGRLLLDVVVGQSSTILELFTGEDESLLVRWDTLLVLDLGLDVVDGVRRLDLKGDGFAREAEIKSAKHSYFVTRYSRLDENLHGGLLAMPLAVLTNSARKQKSR